MQINIQIKEDNDENITLVERFKTFKENKYPHLKIPRLFIHALVKLMEREGE